MDLGLKDKNALVTGGERGIGRDICLSLAREGVHIVYGDIKTEKGKASTQEMVKDLGRKAIGMEIDVSDEVQVVFPRQEIAAWPEHTHILVQLGK